MLFVSSGLIERKERREGEAEFVVAVDRVTGWGRVVIRGPMCLATLESYMLAAWAHQAYAKADRAIWDLREADVKVTIEDAPRLTEFAHMHKHARGPLRVAVVVLPEREQGARKMCRIFQEGARFSPVIFTDHQRAMLWLAEDDPVG